MTEWRIDSSWKTDESMTSVVTRGDAMAALYACLATVGQNGQVASTKTLMFALRLTLESDSVALGVRFAWPVDSSTIASAIAGSSYPDGTPRYMMRADPSFSSSRAGASRTLRSFMRWLPSAETFSISTLILEFMDEIAFARATMSFAVAPPSLKTSSVTGSGSAGPSFLAITCMSWSGNNPSAHPTGPESTPSVYHHMPGGRSAWPV